MAVSVTEAHGLPHSCCLSTVKGLLTVRLQLQLQRHMSALLHPCDILPSYTVQTEGDCKRQETVAEGRQALIAAGGCDVVDGRLTNPVHDAEQVWWCVKVSKVSSCNHKGLL